MPDPNNAKRICIIVFHFGKLPRYIDFFAESTRRNSSVNFLLVGDQFNDVSNWGTNVTALFVKYEDLKARIEKSLAISFPTVGAYKLCDYRPAFGRIFEEELVGYDFWGTADTDVIFGNLRVFLSQNMLESFDFFSFDGRRKVSGSLTVYRNSQFLNNLYTKSPHWRKVFESSLSYIFDETGTHFMGLRGSPDDIARNRRIVSLFELVTWADENNDLRALFTDVIAQPETVWPSPSFTICWRNADLFRVHDEENSNLPSDPYISYHLLHGKSDKRYHIPTVCEANETYLFNEYGLRPKNKSKIGFGSKLLRILYGSLARTKRQLAKLRLIRVKQHPLAFTKTTIE